MNSNIKQDITVNILHCKMGSWFSRYERRFEDNRKRRRIVQDIKIDKLSVESHESYEHKPIETFVDFDNIRPLSVHSKREKHIFSSKR